MIICWWTLKKLNIRNKKRRKCIFSTYLLSWYAISYAKAYTCISNVSFLFSRNLLEDNILCFIRTEILSYYNIFESLDKVSDFWNKNVSSIYFYISLYLFSNMPVMFHWLFIYKVCINGFLIVFDTWKGYLHLSSIDDNVRDIIKNFRNSCCQTILVRLAHIVFKET